MASCSSSVLPTHSEPALPAVPPAAAGTWSVDGLREYLAARYDLDMRGFDVSGKSFLMTAVRDTNALLDRITPEQFRLDERLPFWAEVWPAGIALAEWFLSGAVRKGSRVLELGCGVGLAGIAAVAAGADVTMTDYEQDALEFARYNAAVNLPPRGTASALFEVMDWRAPVMTGRWDIVCGADILYDRFMVDPLLSLLTRAVEPGGLVLLTDPNRSSADSFLKRAAGEGFSAVVEQTLVLHAGRETRVRRCFLRRRS